MSEVSSPTSLLTLEGVTARVPVACPYVVWPRRGPDWGGPAGSGPVSPLVLARVMAKAGYSVAEVAAQLKRKFEKRTLSGGGMIRYDQILFGEVPSFLLKGFQAAGVPVDIEKVRTALALTPIQLAIGLKEGGYTKAEAASAFPAEIVAAVYERPWLLGRALAAGGVTTAGLAAPFGGDWLTMAYPELTLLEVLASLKVGGFDPSASASLWQAKFNSSAEKWAEAVQLITNDASHPAGAGRGMAEGLRRGCVGRERAIATLQAAYPNFTPDQVAFAIAETHGLRTWRVPFNLGQAAPGAMNIASSAPATGRLYSDIQASDPSPRGVIHLPDSAVDKKEYVIRKAGTSAGTAQRKLMMEVRAAGAQMLTELSVSVLYINGPGLPAPNQPIAIVLEASSTSDFKEPKLLGTLEKTDFNWFSHRFEFRYAFTDVAYFRLRVTSSLATSSNFVAYRDPVFKGSVEMAFDLGAANQGALTAEGATPYQGRFWGNLYTNALPVEPGSFTNGIANFGAVGNVLTFHELAKRQAFVGLRVPGDVTLTGLSLQASHNAGSPGKVYPLDIALEASPTEDFANATLLDTRTFTGPMASYQFAFTYNFTDVAYFRLRCLSPIKDGSNFIAYTDLTWAGIAGELPVVTSLVTTVPAATGAFDHFYDFSKAAVGALTVAATAHQPKLLSYFTTNAGRNEPGDFANGVVRFGAPNDFNVFIVHEPGAGRGKGQRYAYMVLDAQVPLVPKQLKLSVQTNVAGSTATNPVQVVVEWAADLSFSSVKALGNFTAFSGAAFVDKTVTLPAGFTLPRGVSYIRLRASTSVADSSNYLAYTRIHLTS